MKRQRELVVTSWIGPLPSSSRGAIALAIPRTWA